MRFFNSLGPSMLGALDEDGQRQNLVFLLMGGFPFQEDVAKSIAT